MKLSPHGRFELIWAAWPPVRRGSASGVPTADAAWWVPMGSALELCICTWLQGAEVSSAARSVGCLVRVRVRVRVRVMVMVMVMVMVRVRVVGGLPAAVSRAGAPAAASARPVTIRGVGLVRALHSIRAEDRRALLCGMARRCGGGGRRWLRSRRGRVVVPGRLVGKD